MKTKRYNLWQSVLLVAGLFVGGCTDEENITAPSANPGEAITFSVSTPQSRTEYVSDTQIHWTDEDMIGIYSAEAVLKIPGADGLPGEETADGHYAEYEVTSAEDYPGDHGTIKATGNILTWGEQDKHTFYGAYPFENVLESGCKWESGQICMQYITNQKCTINETDDEMKRNAHHKAEPDMKNAYMMARKEVMRTQDHVLLAFDPIMTTLDITIEAGGYEVATGIIQPLTITGVNVIMPTGLQGGEFLYDTSSIINIEEGDSESDDNFGKLVSDLREGEEFIHVQFVDENKNKVDIPLSEGETINLMAFLPPIPDEYTNGTKIQIRTAENFNFVATLNGKLGAQHKIHIKLPDIGPDAEINSNWMADLDDNIKLTSMSIPGYVCSGNTTGAEITKLLDMGVRAFDMQAIVGNGTVGVVERICKLSDDITSSLKTFFTEHADEFIIIWYDDDLPLNKRIDDYLNDDKNGFTWIGTLPKTLSEAKKYNIIAIKKCTYTDLGGTNGFIPEKDHKAEEGKNLLFKWKEGNDEFTCSTDFWGVQFIDMNKKNEIYKTIVQIDEQRGYTGIVAIPNIDLSDDNGEFTDDEKLIQAIIDCNYKFILDRN